MGENRTYISVFNSPLASPGTITFACKCGSQHIIGKDEHGWYIETPDEAKIEMRRKD